MADIRIKDLTTTASSTASDDFIAVDGTTNGTRKLNAFSPTFGGNATVTGTLTVNGTSLSANGTVAGYNTTLAWDGGPATITPGFAVGTDAGTTRDLMAFGGSSRAGLIRGYQDGGGTVLWSIGRYTTGSFGEMVRISGTSATSSSLAVYGTTASTTTSTGALVVGNGTSGGLGVGGAIYAGGNIVLSPASVAASGEVGNLRIADSSNTNRKLFFGLDNTVSPNGVGYIQSTLTGTTTIPLQLQPLGGSLSVGNSGTVVTLNGTTASTSTSSGALVVSGGVGVAGAIFAGGAFNTPAEVGIIGSNVNFNIVSNATNGSVYLKSNGGTLYLNNTVGNGDIRLGNTGTVTTVVGTAASTTTLTGAILVSGGVGVAGAVNAGTFYGLVDGVTAPATESGYARIYVDSADGDLKVKFGDGTVKTIATDS